MTEIWVVAERREEGFHEVTLEMLGEARRIADGVGGRVAAVVLGADAGHPVGALASHGADRAYGVEHPLLAEYSTAHHVAALSALVRERDPWVVMIGATQDGSDLAGRLAARLRAPLAGGCIALKLNRDRQLEATKPIHQDKVHATLRWREGVRPVLATIRPGVIGVEKPSSGRTSEVMVVYPVLQADPRDARPVQFLPADPATVDLAEADLIVAAGRGVGSSEKWRMVEELASALGAAVGATRVARDLGWVSSERLVGQTGKTVRPKLYMAVGISGASQHVQGMKDSQRIIVINKDRSAPIFKLADVAVLADLHALVPALTTKIREARAQGR